MQTHNLDIVALQTSELIFLLCNPLKHSGTLTDCYTQGSHTVKYYFNEPQQTLFILIEGSDVAE